MKKIACLGVLLAGFAAFGTGNYGNHKPDGTNVWIGASTGGSWSNVANWRAESPSGYTVEELFQKHCVYDLRALASGAVVTNDLNLGNTYNERDSKGYTMVAGVIFSGDADDEWTVVHGTGKGLFFCCPCVVDVTGGTVTWGEYAGQSYPNKSLRKYGTGRFRLTANGTFWENTSYIYAGTMAFAMSPTVSSTCYKWQLSNGAKMDIESGTMPMACVASASATAAAADTILNIADGATLHITTGFNNWSGNSATFSGDLTGSGTLLHSGGGTQKFLKGKKTGPFAFSGTLITYLGELLFGTESEPVGVNPAVGVVAENSGWLRFSDDQAVTTLEGTGADGGVAVPADKTLTVSGPSGVTTSHVYSARLAGGNFVKGGADYTLTLTGANLYTGATHVAAGTLAVKRPFVRENLCALWRFEDPDNIGAEEYGRLTVTNGFSSYPDKYAPATLVDDGVSGRALHFDGANLNTGSVFDSGPNMHPTYVTPRGNTPFTFSFWMRPTKGTCGRGPNFLRVCPSNGEWGNTGFVFGSPFYDASGASLSAFQGLCFYVGTGWTRGGEWQDQKTSHPYANRIAMTVFEDKNYLFDGAWHHVVGTYSNRVMRLFVDGTLRDERTRDGDMNVTATPYVKMGVFSGTDSAHKYAGDLDEIQWFQGAWSEADVRAEYEARVPRAQPLPDPVAHWTFDTRTVNGNDITYPDVTGNGYDLVGAFTNTTRWTAEAQLPEYAVTYPENLGSKAVSICQLNKETTGAHLVLKDGVDLTEKLPVGTSFTISMRSAGYHNGAFFYVGDGTAAASMQAGDDSCPRYFYWQANGAKYAMNDTGLSNNSNDPNTTGAWGLQTVVYDAQKKTVARYRDGVRVGFSTGVTFSLNARNVQYGLNMSGTPKYAYRLFLDDLRIYDRPLSDAQVRELARTVRYSAAPGGLAAAAAMPSIPTNSPVTVDAGARFLVKTGTDCEVKSVSGAGEVAIDGGATFRAFDYTGLSGTMTGVGRLRLAGSARVPSTATVSAGVLVAAPVVTKADKGLASLFVETSGAVVVPAEGVVTVSDATHGGELAGKRWAIAKGASFALPEDMSGWHTVPATDEEYGFSVKDGTLYFGVKGGGTTIIFR